MTRGSVFLLGGGWNETAYPRTYGRFAAAASANGPARIACVLLDGEDREMHYGWAVHAFAVVGVADTFPVYVSTHRPLLREHVEGATGSSSAGARRRPTTMPSFPRPCPGSRSSLPAGFPTPAYRRAR